MKQFCQFCRRCTAFRGCPVSLCNRRKDIKRGFLQTRNVNAPVKRRGCPGYSLNPGKYVLVLASKKRLRESLALSSPPFLSLQEYLSVRISHKRKKPSESGPSPCYLRWNCSCCVRENTASWTRQTGVNSDTIVAYRVQVYCWHFSTC